MHSTRTHHPNFPLSWSAPNVAITLLLTLLFLLLLFLFVVVTGQPAYAQNFVPATARQAAKMPQFASKLAPARSAARASRYPDRGRPQASFKNPLDPRALGARGFLPADDVVYTNGPINGTTDAWTLNFGFATSNTFTVPSGGASVTGMTFGAWLFPGDVLQTVEVLIGTSEFGGTLSDQVISLSQSNCSGNQYGFNVCTESGNFTAVNLSQGTYWVTLENATVNTGDPVYWDENSGPSMASENSVGTIPSEAFTILGSTTTTCPWCPPPYQCVGDARDFKVIHDFADNEQSPSPGLAIDPVGQVFGTTASGGNNGLGSAYKLALSGLNWMFTPLYSFMGGPDGQNPLPEIIGPERALYGVSDGGIQNCGSEYCGVVYRLRPSPVPCLTALCSWTETVIYRFTGNPDGWKPNGPLVFDHTGNLYGTTLYGGAYGYGTVFQLTPSNGGWSEKVIYSFTGGGDGGHPNSLLLGHDGNLYGSGDVIFQLVRSGSGWTFHVLAGGLSALVQDSAGNLYGISSYTEIGYFGPITFGTIYKLSYGDWGETLVDDAHELHHIDYGYDVFYDLAIDSADRLYASEGAVEHEAFLYYFGGIYRIFGVFNEQSLVGFDGDSFRDLEVDVSGKLYGTTGACGNSNGTVWQLTPP